MIAILSLKKNWKNLHKKIFQRDFYFKQRSNISFLSLGRKN